MSDASSKKIVELDVPAAAACVDGICAMPDASRPGDDERDADRKSVVSGSGRRLDVRDGDR